MALAFGKSSNYKGPTAPGQTLPLGSLASVHNPRPVWEKT